MHSSIISSASILLLSQLFDPVWSCSRVIYNSGPEDGNRLVIGRSMDWLQFPNSSIWALPAGLARTGQAGNNSINWTSKYGSVITTMYDVATVDGMNSAGLVDPSRPGLSIGLWQQYFLDSFATVQEASDALYTSSSAENFQIATKEVLADVPSIGHLALTDPSGDTLIMEYEAGKLVTYRNSSYKVMTNEPFYSDQLAIDSYWTVISNVSLPGTDRPADRFARLSHYVREAPDSSNAIQAICTTGGMLKAVSVPQQSVSISEPNVSPTQWRTYADNKDMVYYYESAITPSVIAIELGKMNLGSGGQSMVLSLNGTWTGLVGDATGKFVPAQPFPGLVCD